MRRGGYIERLASKEEEEDDGDDEVLDKACK